MTTRIFLIAGEASGDVLGGDVMRDLKQVTGGAVAFSGVGGPEMEKQGLTSIFPMTDLSVMGLAEVIRHLPVLYKRFNETLDAIIKENPDILVTIDAPDFVLRVAKKIKKTKPQIKIIHYVAPTVWAWRAGRAKKISRFLDGLLCLFPFEPPYFTRHGLPAAFVGHSLTRDFPVITQESRQAFRAAHGLEGHAPLLCILPGSRKRELESLLPVLADTIDLLKKDRPDLQIIVPTLPHLIDRLGAIAGKAHVFVPKDRAEKYNAFAASDVAIHASGTVALELALCGTPMVTVYKVSALTAVIGKMLIKTPFANLVNILLRHPVVPELLQDEVNAPHVSHVAGALLSHPVLRDTQKEQLAHIAEMLTEKTPQSAARFIMEMAR